MAESFSTATNIMVDANITPSPNGLVRVFGTTTS